jgi:hypothetical protein
MGDLVRVSHIRPVPGDSPLAYRIAILLHSNLDLDEEHEHVDLMGLSRSGVRELAADLEARTGLASCVMAGDSMEEDE